MSHTRLTSHVAGVSGIAQHSYLTERLTSFLQAHKTLVSSVSRGIAFFYDAPTKTFDVSRATIGVARSGISD